MQIDKYPSIDGLDFPVLMLKNEEIPEKPTVRYVGNRLLAVYDCLLRINGANFCYAKRERLFGGRPRRRKLHRNRGECLCFCRGK